MPFMCKMQIRENSMNSECKRSAGGFHTANADDNIRIGLRIFRRHNEPCLRGLFATRICLLCENALETLPSQSAVARTNVIERLRSCVLRCKFNSGFHTTAFGSLFYLQWYNTFAHHCSEQWFVLRDILIGFISVQMNRISQFGSMFAIIYMCNKYANDP